MALFVMEILEVRHIRNIKRGELRIRNLGDSVKGSVQSGIRPALIISNNTGNKHGPVVIVAPIASRTATKKFLPTHIVLTTNMGMEKESLVLLEQIVTIDKKDIGRKIAKLSPRLMAVVDKKINVSLGIRRYTNRRKRKEMI